MPPLPPKPRNASPPPPSIVTSRLNPSTVAKPTPGGRRPRGSSPTRANSGTPSSMPRGGSRHDRHSTASLHDYHSSSPHKHKHHHHHHRESSVGTTARPPGLSIGATGRSSRSRTVDSYTDARPSSAFIPEFHGRGTESSTQSPLKSKSSIGPRRTRKATKLLEAGTMSALDVLPPPPSPDLSRMSSSPDMLRSGRLRANARDARKAADGDPRIELQTAYVSAMVARARHMYREYELKSHELGLDTLLQITATRATASIENEIARNESAEQRGYRSLMQHETWADDMCKSTNTTVEAIQQQASARSHEQLTEFNQTAIRQLRKASTMKKMKKQMQQILEKDSPGMEKEEERFAKRMKEIMADATRRADFSISLLKSQEVRKEVAESGEFEKGLQAKWEEDLTVKYDVLLEGVRNQIQSMNHRQTANAVDALDDLGGKSGLDSLTRSAEVIEGEVKVQQLAYSLLKEKIADAYNEFRESRQRNLDRREAMLEGHYTALTDYLKVLTEQAYERLERSGPEGVKVVTEEEEAFIATLEKKRKKWYQSYKEASVELFNRNDEHLSQVGERIVESALERLGGVELKTNEIKDACRRWEQDEVAELEDWHAGAVEELETASFDHQQKLLDTLTRVRESMFDHRRHVTRMVSLIHAVQNHRHEEDSNPIYEKRLSLLQERNKALSHGTQEPLELRIDTLKTILKRTPPSSKVVELLEKAVNQYDGEQVIKRGGWLKKTASTFVGFNRSADI